VKAEKEDEDAEGGEAKKAFDETLSE